MNNIGFYIIVSMIFLAPIMGLEIYDQNRKDKMELALLKTCTSMSTDELKESCIEKYVKYKIK